MGTNAIVEPNELYGTFMQYLHISTEGKNLQYLTNELFKAAGKDIQRGSDSTEALDQVLDTYLDNLGVKNGDSKAEAQKALKDRLANDYSNLKQTLQKVRVFGVGKNTVEKIMTAAGTMLKAMTPVVAACCVVGAAALAYMSFQTGMDAWGNLGKGNGVGFLVNNTVSNIEGDAAKNMMMLAGIASCLGLQRSVELNYIRANMKVQLKDAVGAKKTLAATPLYNKNRSNSSNKSK